MPRMVQSALSWLNRTGDLALSTILPMSCVFCGSEIDSEPSRLCTACTRRLAECCPPHVCQRCAMPLPTPASGPSAGGPPASELAESSGGDQPASSSPSPPQRCFHCKKIPYRFSRTFALGLYRGVLQEAVILAKQAARRVVASTLASMAAESHREEILALNCHYVCPIPSHWRRRVSRRGTPAQILAETFAGELGLPFHKALRRTRSTRKQGMLSPEERRKNVDGSFAVNTGYVLWSAAFSPRGKHVLLVDDVLTTGATGNAAATALLQAGASEVTMAVIARATG